MSINRQTEDAGELQIGPTDKGMVRVFVRTDTFDLPMDFTPDEARDIAEEILAAADMVEKSKS